MLEGRSRVLETMDRLVWKGMHKEEKKRKSLGKVQQNWIWAISGYWLGLGGEGIHIYTSASLRAGIVHAKLKTAVSDLKELKGILTLICIHHWDSNEPWQVTQTGGKDPPKGFLY